MVYAYNGMLFSLKREEYSDTCYAWMDLDYIILSIRGQSQKDKD